MKNLCTIRWPYARHLVYLEALFVLFIFWPGYAIAQYEELYIPVIPSNIAIELREDGFRKLQKNILDSSSSQLNIIESKHKKYIPASIVFNENGVTKNCADSKVRINGDWKDHLDPGRGISSLTINMSQCYVGGVSRFRLLLPETKNGSMEIFWSMVLEYYGFPALYTQKVEAKLNGRVYPALFQEMPSTAFLERHGIREAPILENAEQANWIYNVRYDYFKNVLNAKVIGSWYSADPNQLDVDVFEWGKWPQSFTADLDNKEYATKSPLRSKIVMRGASQFLSKNVRNYTFYHALQQLFGEHGSGHNQKFIYMPTTNSFIPIYYDWMGITYKELPDRTILSTAGPYLMSECVSNLGYPDPEFQREFERRSGEKLSDAMKCTFAKVKKDFSHLSNWEDDQVVDRISNGLPPIELYQVDIDSWPLDSGFKDAYLDVLALKGGIYNLCQKTHGKISCTPIGVEAGQKILLNRRYTKVDDFNIISTINFGEIDGVIDSSGEKIKGPGVYNISVESGQKYYIYVPQGGGRIINISLKGPGSRAVILGELSDTDSVSVLGDAPNLYKDTRHDELMLTGCVTFLDTKFDNPSLSSSATGCEDAINILHSKGKIKNINIQNATEDALDLDFSNIEIESISVSGAGNDCLDISTGNYDIGTANLKSCGDKAVSAGEYAQVKLGKVAVDGATLGLVAKDGALLSASQFEGFNIKDKCIDTYIKKKRFPIGHAYALSNQCIISPGKASASRN